MRARGIAATSAVLLAAALGGCGGSGGSDPAPVSDPAPGPVAVRVERVFAGLAFSSPVALVPEPTASGSRWFAVEKAGVVRAFPEDPGTTNADVFVDIADRVEAGPGEAGLLGFAFHPAFGENGEVFLSYTAPGPGSGVALVSRVSRFRSPDGGATLDPSTEEIVLAVDQPFTNHNGGQIAFGPDGYLYLGLGDGGSGGDPLGNGQDTGTLLGAFLRLDVDGGIPYAIPPDNPFAGGGGRSEIFAWGFRNPWRWSFDAATGELWCGDVGQGEWEEVDVVRRGGNYGWSVREGAHCFPTPGCDATGLTDPVAEYSHAEGCSITGGYVYRGSAIPALAGTYLYGDFCTGTVWGLPPGGTPRVLAESGLRLSSFGQGPDGEVYLLDFAGGGIYRLGPSTP